jgi:hypothetical protein
MEIGPELQLLQKVVYQVDAAEVSQAASREFGAQFSGARAHLLKLTQG